ncbi:MAG: TraB/GumN family protein [Thermoplasmatota archaeon]
MITLLGTGHVFDLRKRVQNEIFSRSPTMVALELDPPRFEGLRHPEAAKGGPPVYRLLASIQGRMAEQYGVEAGDEMIAAADAAEDLRLPIALIDRNAQEVLQRVWREMRFRERFRLIGALTVGMIMPAKNVDKDLEKIQDDYQAAFEELGAKFPTIRRVLIDERDQHMANAIRELSGQHPNLVVVMGDGHVDGVAAILAKTGIQVEMVRLRALRADEKADEAPKTEPASVSFRVQYGL